MNTGVLFKNAKFLSFCLSHCYFIYFEFYNCKRALKIIFYPWSLPYNAVNQILPTINQPPPKLSFVNWDFHLFNNFFLILFKVVDY